MTRLRHVALAICLLSLLQACGVETNTDTPTSQLQDAPLGMIVQPVIADPPTRLVDTRGRKWKRSKRAEMAPPDDGGVDSGSPEHEVATDTETAEPDYDRMPDAELIKQIRPVSMYMGYEYTLDEPIDVELRDFRDRMRLMKSGAIPTGGGEPSQRTVGTPVEELKGLQVIQWDDRVQKRSNTSFPFSPQVLLKRGPNGNGIDCSGTLIGRATMVTAAHCVKNASNQWYTTRVWAPGVDSQDANPYPYGSYQGCYWNIAPAYNGNISTDYALLEFSDLYPACNLYPGDSAQYLGWGANFLPGAHYGYVYGYPVGQGAGTPGCVGVLSCNWPQIWGIGTAGMDNDGVDLDHYTDTTNGQSGAGLYIINSLGVRTVVGVHARSLSNPVTLEYWNEARRIEGNFYWAIYNYTTAPGSVNNP